MAAFVTNCHLIYDQYNFTVAKLTPDQRLQILQVDENVYENNGLVRTLHQLLASHRQTSESVIRLINGSLSQHVYSIG